MKNGVPANQINRDPIPDTASPLCAQKQGPNNQKERAASFRKTKPRSELCSKGNSLQACAIPTGGFSGFFSQHPIHELQLPFKKGFINKI